MELGFELKETEYNFDSAEIVLLNIDDRSLVTRQVAKVLDSFAYELEDDITAHYGDWRGQLRFEQAGEVYVSSPVKFRIENDLSNERPPQLSDVQSWVSLKRYADSLTEELKQAVLSVEGIEDTFNENETERQSRFSNAEQSRQSTFETNESERNETFESNETIRQTQELEREKAETNRQTIFDNNEAGRFETFNTNETTRQVNENARQQAETQRQLTFETNESERQTTFEVAELTREQAEEQRVSAESNRVSAEEQRKTDHANRSAELASKADKIVLENLVKNGDFSNGGQGWVTGPNIKNIVYGHNYVEFEGAGSSIMSATNWVSHPPNIFPDKGDILYVYSLATRISGEGNVYIGSWYWAARGNTPLNDKTLVSYWGVQTIEPSGNYVHAVLSADKGVMVRFESVIYLNLTQTFSAGNEPTKEEMDELIKIIGYIDNEYALNNKEMLIWTLALIRRNKNAIITLGGTV